MLTKSIVSLILLASSLSFAQGSPSGKKRFEDIKRVKAECAEDLKTTGCDKVKGREQIKCVIDYKKANPSFAPSPQCQEAREQLRKDRLAKREEKKDK